MLKHRNCVMYEGKVLHDPSGQYYFMRIGVRKMSYRTPSVANNTRLREQAIAEFSREMHHVNITALEASYSAIGCPMWQRELLRSTLIVPALVPVIVPIGMYKSESDFIAMAIRKHRQITDDSFYEMRASPYYP